MKTYSKSSVQFHGIGYAGPSVPAVNVKVGFCRLPLPLELGSFSDDGGATVQTALTDADFDWDWIDANVTGDTAFEIACMSGWEQLGDEAKEIFGTHVTVYSEGRSSGWAIVDGLKDFDDWDAIDLGKWRRFERYARALTDDIPRQMIELIYMNEWATRDDVGPDPFQVVHSALYATQVETGLVEISMAAEATVTALRTAGLLPKETA